MRTSEERIQELHSRMAALRARDNRRSRIAEAGLVVLALAAALTIAVLVGLFPVKAPAEGGGGAMASIFAGHEALGYIVVSLAAFLLGALVTVLCFRLDRRRKETVPGDPAEERDPDG